MTVSEMLAVCGVVEAQGLSMMVLAAPRLRDGKRLPPPKRIAHSLRVTCVGGNDKNYFLAITTEEVKRFAASRYPTERFLLREYTAAEKMSRELRRMAGVADPPEDPWAEERSLLGDLPPRDGAKS